MAVRAQHPKRSGYRGSAPVRITTAPHNAGADIDRRRRRYLFSMAIRTLCFVGAIVVGPGWIRWVLVLLAFVLPYVAVVLANSTTGPRMADLTLRLTTNCWLAMLFN